MSSAAAPLPNCLVCQSQLKMLFRSSKSLPVLPVFRSPPSSENQHQPEAHFKTPPAKTPSHVAGCLQDGTHRGLLGMPRPPVNSPAGNIKNYNYLSSNNEYSISGSGLRQGLPAAMSSSYQGTQAHTAVFVVPADRSHLRPATLPHPFPETHPVSLGTDLYVDKQTCLITSIHLTHH